MRVSSDKATLPSDRFAHLRQGDGKVCRERGLAAAALLLGDGDCYACHAGPRFLNARLVICCDAA